MTLVQTEPKKIIYWEPIIVSDMQWPCPDGFHVPKLDEYSAIKDTVNTLSSWMQSYRTYLKLPFNWCRLYTDWSVSYTGSQWWYWTSQWWGGNKAYYVMFKSSSYYGDSVFTTYWCGIRPMKNTPAVPDSSWTVLFDWSSVASWAWVFWNQSAWLISVSSDGSTRYTIADKNLWATTVWNYGDAETDANCGNFYQFGNNYWFPHSWSITTSSTTVDATWYWPLNYYSSATFIARSSSPYWWDYSQNKNLRWWVTQWTSEKATEVKAVYLWEVKVRPSFKPKTFTISRTEQSNMSSWWTYSDDAAWLTAGDGAFDDFFWYSAVLLNTSGVETAEMKQSWWVFTGAMSTLGNITSGDNVMIKFPVRWIKMSKSWSTVTLSITEELDKDGYQYYAFQTWTLSNPWTAKDAFYLGAYEGGWNGSKMWSRSWSFPYTSQSESTYTSMAKNIGSWYNIVWFYQRMYVNALYMMKYWNPNSQSVVWAWYTWWSEYQQTWATNSITNATWATNTSTTWRIKLFWIEDRWGNVIDLTWWAYTDSNQQLYVMLTWWEWDTSWWQGTWTVITTTGWSNLSAIAGNNKAMFCPVWTVSDNTFSTYYTDYITSIYGSILLSTYGQYNTFWSAYRWGIFGMAWYYTWSSNSSMWSRIMYLNWLT